MKRIFVCLALVGTVVAARADFVIQQKVVGTLQNGVITLKIKGNKIRQDMPSNRLGDISTIQDIFTGDTITMIHEKQLARKETGAQYRERMGKLNATMTNAVIPKPVDTGKVEKVGNYDAEIYTWTNNRDMSGTLWIAKNYPNAEKIKSEFARLNQSPVRQLSKAITPDSTVLPGVVVKSDVKSPTDETTTTFLLAKEQPVDAKEFEVPADYHLVTPEETSGH